MCRLGQLPCLLLLLLLVCSALAEPQVDANQEQRRSQVIHQSEVLASQNRYAEAHQVLRIFEAESGLTLRAAHNSIDEAFSTYVRSHQPQGQHYLLWLFGIVPLLFCVVTVGIATRLRPARAVSSADAYEDRRFKRYVGAIALVLVVSFYVGSTLFYLLPQFFYFREWEYNRYEGFGNLIRSETWNRPAKGEMSRKFLLNCQATDQVSVSLNNYGFRATPDISAKTKILFFGDSFGWGMNVTDDQTFQWTLSKELNQQVLAGLTKPAMLANYPHFDTSPLFVELYAWERFLLPIEPVADLQPFSVVWGGRVSGPVDSVLRSFAIQTHGRYYLPAILTRLGKRLGGDLEYWVNGTYQDYIFPFTTASDFRGLSEIDPFVDQLVKRSDAFNALGFTYLAVPVPERNIFVSEFINARSINIHKYFRHMAALKGVHVIDVLGPFVENDGMSMYQIADGHWSGRGAELTGKVVAQYVRDHRLLLPRSEQIGPDTSEPRYEEEYRALLARYFRPDTPARDRTCVRSLSEFLN
jgi:hypothetical protein